MNDRLRPTRSTMRQAAGLILVMRWLQGLAAVLLVVLFAPSRAAATPPLIVATAYFLWTARAFIRYRRGRVTRLRLGCDLLINVGALLLLAHHAGGITGPVLYLVPMTVGIFIAVFGAGVGAVAVAGTAAGGLVGLWAEQTARWPIPPVAPFALAVRPTIDVGSAIAAGVLLLFGSARTLRRMREKECDLARETARARAAADFQAALAEVSPAAGIGSTVGHACERARRLLGCRAAMICLVDDDALAVRGFVPDADAPGVVRLPLDSDEPAARAVREGRTILAETHALAPAASAVDLVACGVRRSLAVPLRGRDETVLGALVLFDDGTLRDPDSFTVRGEIVAHATASLIDNARLVDELQDETRHVRALLRLSEEIGQAAPYEDTLRAVCALTRELLVADRASTFLWDPETERFIPAVQDGMTPSELEQWNRLGFSPADAADGVPEPYAEPLRQGRLMAVPLDYAGKLYGLLAARRVTTPGRFAARHLAVLQAIARQAGLALANRRLHDEERDATAQAETLLDVARELNLALEAPALVARLARRAVEMTRADVALVAVREPRGSGFRVQGMEGVSAEHAEALAHAEVGGDLYADAAEAVSLAPDWRRRLGGDTELTLPMAWGGNAVGVLTLLWHGAARPSGRQTALARGFSHQAAVALQNVRLVEDLREASRLKSEFVATMSHELRTPLNVIMGYTDLLLEQAFGTLDEEALNVLGRIQRSARELFDLISATLDLNRLEAGKSRVTIEPVAVSDLFAQLEAETAERLDTREVDVRWHVTSDLPVLETDRGKLRIVLKNLVGNAIKFTERGRVTVAAAPTDDAVVFTVADTGVGIRDDDLPVIFDMFRQVESANTRRHGGVGLGLYIVKRLLGELRGRIDVESELGVGTTFHVRLPVRAAA